MDDTTLNRVMQRRKITVNELARLSGVHPRTIRRYRTGVSIPRDRYGVTANGKRLAAALQTVPEKLFPFPGRP